MTTASKPGFTRQVLDGQFPWLIVTSQDSNGIIMMLWDSDGIIGKFLGLILMLWDSDGIIGELSWPILTFRDSDGIMGKFPRLIMMLWDSDWIMEEFPWRMTSQDSEGVSFAQLDVVGF